MTFCGIEIRKHKESQGFELTQQAYEQELLERWPQAKGSTQIHLRVPDPEASEEDPDATLVREAQALTGALLWLSTGVPRVDLCSPCDVKACSEETAIHN